MMLARRCRKAQALRARVLTLQQQQQLRLASSAPPASASSAPAATASKAAGGKAQESDFSRYAGIAVFSAIVATTAYLGTWQTQRYFWKVDLVEERKRELHEDAVALPKDASAKGKVDDIEYRQLRVTGKFKPNSTYYLYPRSAPAESTDNVATPKSGGYLYSLLERDGGTPVIVNRGWLPRKLLDQHMASETKEEHGEISLVGVLRHGEEKGNFTPDNDVKNRQFFYLQHEEVARAMGIEGELLPVILDALSDERDSAEASFSHPLRKKLQNYTEFYMTPSKHAGYAATWYSFSIAATVMAYFRFKKGNAVIRPKKQPLRLHEWTDYPPEEKLFLSASGIFSQIAFVMMDEYVRLDEVTGMLALQKSARSSSSSQLEAARTRTLNQRYTSFKVRGLGSPLGVLSYPMSLPSPSITNAFSRLKSATISKSCSQAATGDDGVFHSSPQSRADEPLDRELGHGAEQSCNSSNSRLVLRLSPRSRRLLWCFILLYQLANGLLLASMAAMYGSVEKRGTILWFLRYNFLFSRAQRFLTSVHRYASAGYALFAVLFVFGALSMIWHSVRQERLCYSSARSSPSPSWHDQGHLVQSQLSSPPTARRTLVTWYKQLESLYESFDLGGRYFAIGFFAREIVESALQTMQAFQSSRSLSNVFVNQSYGVLIFLNCFTCVVLPKVYKRINVAKGQLMCILLDLLLDFAWGTVIPLVVFWPYLLLFLAYQQDAYVAVPPENVQKEVEFILVMSTFDFILSTFPFVSSAVNLYAIKQFLKHDGDELKLSQKPGAGGDGVDTATIHASEIEDSLAVVAASNTPESAGRVLNKPLTRSRWAIISLQALFLFHGALILAISLASQWRSNGSHATEAFECLHRMHPWLSTKEACVGRVISCATAGINGASEDIEAALSFFDEATLSNLVISECPSLQVPPEIHRFRHLSVFTIENSHVLEWTEDAALTDEFFDSLQTIRVTNVTFASAPNGILNDPLPKTSEWVVMRDVDMGEHLDTVGDNWQHLKYFYCDLCNISSFPSVVESMTGLVELSLSFNDIDTIEDSNVESLTSLENLWFDGLPLTKFPDELWKKSSQMGDLSFQNTQIAEIPALVDRIADENLQMYAFGTPLCENETKPTRVRYLSCVEQKY